MYWVLDGLSHIEVVDRSLVMFYQLGLYNCLRCLQSSDLDIFRLGEPYHVADLDIRFGDNLMFHSSLSHAYFFVGGDKVYSQTGWGFGRIFPPPGASTGCLLRFTRSVCLSPRPSATRTDSRQMSVQCSLIT